MNSLARKLFKMLIAVAVNLQFKLLFNQNDTTNFHKIVENIVDFKKPDDEGYKMSQTTRQNNIKKDDLFVVKWQILL